MAYLAFGMSLEYVRNLFEIARFLTFSYKLLNENAVKISHYHRDDKLAQISPNAPGSQDGYVTACSLFHQMQPVRIEIAESEHF